ncbi:MAG: metallophosphoesterase [Solirubrobacteraceae bacterium]
MAVRRLIISDLHFGCTDALLAAPAALERIEPELAWADELVINGDLFELVFTSLEEAVGAARPFLALANRHVGRVHYLPGNHDHHLVSLSGDERRFAQILGTPATPFARVAPAERLLRSLCPQAEVVCAYPLCDLDGMRITHGHYITPHLGSSELRLMDWLAWCLTGEQSRPDRLTAPITKASSRRSTSSCTRSPTCPPASARSSSSTAGCRGSPRSRARRSAPRASSAAWPMR